MKNKFQKLAFAFLFLLSAFACSKKEETENLIATKSGQALVTQNSIVNANSLSLTIFNETEPNNTLATANGPVSINSSIVGLISSYSDADWFKINSTTGLSFYLDGSTYYLTGYVYNSNGTCLGTISYHSNYVIAYTGVYIFK